MSELKYLPWPNPKWDVLRYEGIVMPDGTCEERITLANATETSETDYRNGDTLWAKAHQKHIADERDELRQALKSVLELWKEELNGDGWVSSASLEKARAMLAKYPKP